MPWKAQSSNTRPSFSSARVTFFVLTSAFLGTISLRLVSNKVMLHLDSLNPRNFWPLLPSLARLYFFILSVTCVYILISLTRVLLGLHSLKRPSPGLTQEATRLTLAALQARLANSRQLFFLSCLLFGFCFLLDLPSAFIVLVNSKVSTLNIIFMQLNALIACATDIFAFFLLVHAAQWVVSARLESFARSRKLS